MTESPRRRQLIRGINIRCHSQQLLMSYRFVGPHQALPAPLPGYMIGLGFPAPDQVIYSSAKLENINCIVEPTMESGGLYLGDIISTKKEELLKKHNIRAVLSCGVEAVYNPRDTPNHTVESSKSIMAKDLNTYDMSQHFQQTFDFISEQANQGRNVLVHCHAGVSRSATILAAYIMRKNTWTLEKTLSFIKAKRARAKPNQSFMKQLKELQDKILGPLAQTRNVLNRMESSQGDQPKDAVVKDKSAEKQNSKTSTKKDLTPKKQEIEPVSIHQILEKRSIDTYCFETPKKKAENFHSQQTIETQEDSEKKPSTPPLSLKFKTNKCRVNKQASSTQFVLQSDVSNLSTARELQKKQSKNQYHPQKSPVMLDTVHISPYSAPRSFAHIPSQQPPIAYHNDYYHDHRTMSDNKISPAPFTHYIRPVTRLIFPVQQPVQQARPSLYGQSRVVENIQYAPRYSEGSMGVAMVRPSTKVALFDQVQPRP